MTPTSENSGHADLEKSRLRAVMKSRLASIPAENRKSVSLRACAALKGTLPWRNARSVLVFLSFGDEIDTGPILDAARENGKSVFVPRVADGDMEFRRSPGPDGPFVSGPFGIREPLSDAPEWNPLASPGPALVVVPGLAFDSRGGRLGRGGGFYDRFIDRIRLEARSAGELPPLCLGFACSAQVVEAVPSAPHDQRLDGLITEETALLF